MDLLHVPAPPGAFEVEVNPYFSCDFALKHIEICDLGTYAAPFIHREPTSALRCRKHMYTVCMWNNLRPLNAPLKAWETSGAFLKSQKCSKHHQNLKKLSKSIVAPICMAPFVHVHTDMFYLSILWSTSLRRLYTEWRHHFEHNLSPSAFLNFIDLQNLLQKSLTLIEIQANFVNQ